MLYSQPYIKIQRKIDMGSQIRKEIEESILLFEDKIVTATDTFLIMDVYDISYKKLINQEGFLYLHTNRGLYSYYVKTPVEGFLNAYHSLKK